MPRSPPWFALFPVAGAVTLLLTGAWHDDLGGVTTIDDYEYLRRVKIDLCSALPTLAEVDAIEAGTLTRADFESVIDTCLAAATFPPIVSRWVDDFILPSSGFAGTAETRFINRAQVGGVTYYYEPLTGADLGANGNCGGVGVVQVTDAWFARGQTINVCPGMEWDVSTPAQVGNAFCPVNAHRAGTDQCSCGPRMLWCILDNDGNTRSGGFGDVRAGIAAEVKQEPARLVEEIVADGSDFREIFTARRSFRSDFLQQYLEATQALAPYEDAAAIAAIDTMSDADKEAQAAAGGRILSTLSATPAAIVERPLHSQHSGILTSYELLVRQPTQPNLANQVYRFWTCEDITPRGYGYSLGDASGGPISLRPNGLPTTDLHYVSPDHPDVLVAPLELDVGPNEVLTDQTTECYGCHKTVNSLAAFRNNWNLEGRNLTLFPTAYTRGARFDGHEEYPETGVFLQGTGDGLVALGQALHDSEVVQRCIVRRVYRGLTGRELDPVRDEATIDLHHEAFVGSGSVYDSFNIKQLYKSIVMSVDYMRGR